MRRLLICLIALALAPSFAVADTVTGTVTYLQRMMLPPDAVVEIQLQDVSRADAPAKVLANQRIEGPGAPPYPFTLTYDPAAIDPSGTYVVRAAARQGEKLLLTTDTHHPVLTRGAGTHVEIVMKAVETRAETKPDSDFVNTHWKIVTLGGETIPVGDNQREPHLILRIDDSYNATVGCNMIRGGYTIEDGQVAFGPGAMTMMACQPPYDRFERNLVEMLGAAVGHEIAGESMALLDAAGQQLATFRAIYF